MGVIGLGYVGLPVACIFAEAGFTVIGVDIDRERVDAIVNAANSDPLRISRARPAPTSGRSGSHWSMSAA